MSESTDPTKVWVYGKIEKGWYIARCRWNQEYARHLQKDLGYQVVRSIEKPEIQPQ